MDIIIAIEYLIGVMLGLYLTGLMVVWFYEIKRNSLRERMRLQMKFLENSHLSMALLHAKTYKIKEDYNREALGMEMVQQFILRNVLLIRNMQDSLSASALSSRRIAR